jgi:hypothetical protein
VPQLPQLLGSTLVSLHEVPHLVVPAPQLSAHCPFEQTWPLEHALPQLPQFAGSNLVSTQPPLQAAKPPVQLPASLSASGSASACASKTTSSVASEDPSSDPSTRPPSLEMAPVPLLEELHPINAMPNAARTIPSVMRMGVLPGDTPAP